MSPLLPHSHHPKLSRNISNHCLPNPLMHKRNARLWSSSIEQLGKPVDTTVTSLLINKLVLVQIFFQHSSPQSTQAIQSTIKSSKLIMTTHALLPKHIKIICIDCGSHSSSLKCYVFVIRYSRLASVTFFDFVVQECQHRCWKP